MIAGFGISFGIWAVIAYGFGFETTTFFFSLAAIGCASIFTAKGN